MQTLRELLAEHNRDELIELKADLQSQIDEWHEEYGVDSPGELRVLAADTETAGQTREINTTASEWALAEYRLSILEDAIENYTTYSQDFQASA